jgi:hypothetical protein
VREAHQACHFQAVARPEPVEIESLEGASVVLEVLDACTPCAYAGTWQRDVYTRSPVARLVPGSRWAPAAHSPQLRMPKPDVRVAAEAQQPRGMAADAGARSCGACSHANAAAAPAQRPHRAAREPVRPPHRLRRVSTFSSAQRAQHSRGSRMTLAFALVSAMVMMWTAS